MTLTPDWAPNIHPIVVHFPIALLITAAAIDLLSLWMHQSSAVRDTATWVYLAGTGCALLAYVSGRSGAEAMALGAVEPLVHEHENWAFLTTWFFAFFASLRLAVSYILPPKPVIRITAAGLGLIGIVMLVETAQQGAALVYQHGIGVKTAETDLP